MNASSNHSVLELDQFDFAKNSISLILRALFKPELPLGVPTPIIDSALDRLFESANQATEVNLSDSFRISGDIEYCASYNTTDALTLVPDPFSSVIDESFLPTVNDMESNLIPLLLDYSCGDSPGIPISCDLRSYCKSSNICSSIFAAITHLAVIFSLALTNPTGSTGQYGNSPEPIFVRLIDPNSSIVQQCSIASVDSAASCPSIAQRSKGEKDKRQHQTEEPLPKSALEFDDGNRHGGGEGNVDTVATAKSEARFMEQALSLSRTIEKNDDANFESLSMMDSVASPESAASKENRSAAPHGEEADQFKKMILSAIHEVAFYPRKAANNRESGETLVSFTILSDGSLENITVSRKSGSEILDNAAIQIVEKASSQFPPIPESLGHKKLNYVIPITFRKKL